ncbi:MAG: type II secretion system F family protein [Phycisphaerae bacterium]|nr:type II secretion system F family protein [Phycisphaerae bacterium]
MAWFEYDGQCPNGTAISGRIEAANHSAADEMLRTTMRLTVSDVRQARSPAPRSRISDEDFMFFNEQLASLASAGMALDAGLEQLARDVSSPRLRGLIQDIAGEVRRGEPLEQAVARHEARMPVLYSRVIRAGVASGQLSATLLSLNQHLRLMGETRRLLWETLSYPAIVLLLAMGVISFFFIAIVPMFQEIFADFGVRLPVVTLLLIDAGKIYPFLLTSFAITVVLLILVWQALRFTLRGRLLREWVVSHVPIVGRVYRASLISRFVRSVATCVRSGITLPEALRLAGGVTGSPGLARDAEYVAAAAEAGNSILDATQVCAWIPGIFGYTVQVALGREALPAALAQLSTTYEARATHTQAMLRAALLPTLVVILGGTLFFGIAAMFLPLVSLVNSVSGS